MSESPKDRPLPETRNAGAKYWRAAAAGALLLPRCRPCARAFWHPRPRCPYCGCADVEWMTSTGKGAIHTYTVVRQSSDPYFKPKVPYVVAMVALDDGPSIMSNVVGCPVEAVRIGARVCVAFEPGTADVGIPVFKLEAGAA